MSDYRKLPTIELHKLTRQKLQERPLTASAIEALSC